MLNGLNNKVNSLCPIEDITNEIKESEEIVARIIDCQRQVEESRKTVDSQVPPVITSPSTVYIQPEQHIILLQAILWNHDFQSYHLRNSEVTFEMAVILGSLQILYSWKWQHFDNRQVQWSKFFTWRKCCEDRVRYYTHKFNLQCRRQNATEMLWQASDYHISAHGWDFDFHVWKEDVLVPCDMLTTKLACTWEVCLW